MNAFSSNFDIRDFDRNWPFTSSLFTVLLVSDLLMYSQQPIKNYKSHYFNSMYVYSYV